MKIKVTKDLCEIKENEIWNVGDYNVHTVQVELSPEFNGLVNKVRYFVEDNSYDMLITDNVAQVPYEATVMEGTIKIGVYGYDADTDILVQSTSPVNKYITSGTYTGDPDNTQPLTPTDKEQMETAIQKNTNDITDLKENKQDKLISGVNIKTINNESILSSGNLTLVAEETDPIFTNSPAYSITDNDITYWNNKANMSDIPDVSNFITKDVDNLTYYTKSTDMQTAINNAVGNERTARENADNSLQNQIDAITVSSDVVDVVSTYQDLVDYDTQHIKANDIIKVMQDSTHDNAISYYRWVIVNHAGSWEYVGSEGPYYTKSETDILLNAKQNTITTTNKLQSDLVDDTNQTNLFVTSTEKTTWNNKLDQSDLTDYVKNTDYATNNKGGVIKTSDTNGTYTQNGVLIPQKINYANYQIKTDFSFISKGTLENVITGKNLETANNKVTSISSSSTDVQYPSAKCVYDNDVIIKDDVNTKYDYLYSLTNLFGKITGTGTSVTLNDTSNTIMKLNLDTTTSSQVTTTGKNLFNTSLRFADETQNGVTLKNNNDGSFTITGTATSNFQFTASLTLEEMLSIGTKLPAGTYTQQAGGRLQLYDANNTFIMNTFQTFTTEQETYIKGMFIEITSGTTYNRTFYYQVESGSSVTSFEPYTGGQPAPSPSYPQEIHTITGNNVITISNSDNTKSQTYPINLGDIEVCKIGDYQDVLFKNTMDCDYYNSSLELNKWYIRKRIGKRIFNGDESWATDTSGGFNRFSTGVPDIIVTSGRNANSISNYFRSSTDNAYGIIWNTGQAIYLYPESGITTVSQFKTWLSAHNTTVYYPLATPTYILLNDTLQTQLNNMQYALAYDTQTNISQTNTDLPFIINAETFVKIGGGGTSDYTNLTNKPKINNVELKGNKTLNDLGIQPAGNYLTEETDPTVPSYVKNITQANITSWNNKLDSSKVKNTNSTTAGDVYDVIYINNMIGDVETILTRLTTGSGV